MKLRRGDAIEVRWIDSHYAAAGWMDESDLDCPPMVIRSVCIFIGRDKHCIHTAADRSEALINPGIMRDLKIPRGCLKEIRKLK